MCAEGNGVTKSRDLGAISSGGISPARWRWRKPGRTDGESGGGDQRALRKAIGRYLTRASGGDYLRGGGGRGEDEHAVEQREYDVEARLEGRKRGARGGLPASEAVGRGHQEAIRTAVMRRSSHPEVLRRSSDGHQAAITLMRKKRRSRKPDAMPRKVMAVEALRVEASRSACGIDAVGRPSGGHREVIGRSSGSHWEVIRGRSEGIRRSSGGHSGGY